MGHFPSSFGFVYILVVVDYVSKWIEAIPCRHNDHKIVIHLLKENLLSRFGIPRAIISDGGISTYRLVYEKSCHLPVELEHKSFWVIKAFNSNLDDAGNKIYKVRCERLRLLMINEIPADIRWLIDAKVRLVGMISVNREDKIKFVKDGMSKESLDDILRSFETHPSGYGQREIQSLWKLFQKESAQFSLRNLTLKDHLCTFWISLWKVEGVRSAAIDLGRAIVETKLHLVYGGGDRELSKLVSEAAFVRGSQVLGIIPKALNL
ncbi:hypothetical protein WN944_023976 [Citrus x changshan-huyou]|uniref:Uncharacterized protein n=1 Tax=Citrus x changshan-huyou TaxID=2935761 RepID=A0AAP0LMU2_9ROSI